MDISDHTQLSDEEFYEQFKGMKFPPGLFSHEAHLRLTWILLEKYDLSTACAEACTLIKSFDATFGDGTKFHRTVTEAAVRIVNHYKEKDSFRAFQLFLGAHQHLLHQFKECIDSHYTFDIFQHENAAKSFVKPDKSPF